LDYEQGFAKTVNGAEGYTKSRTILNGHIKSETEWGDRTTTFQYDVFGDLKQVSSPELRTVIYTTGFPEQGGYEQTISTSEGSIVNTFNGLGLQVKSIKQALAVGTGDTVNTKVELGYNDHGSLLYTTVPHDRLITDTTSLRNSFDTLPNGIPLSSETIQGGATSYYYKGPFEVQISDFNGNKQTISTKPFRGFGSEQPTEILYSGPQPNSEVDILVSKEYYPEGMLKSVATGNEFFEYVYDSHGQIDTFESKAEGVIQYDHDLNGNLISLKKANGNPVTIKYDNLDRETDRTYSDPTANVSTRYNESLQKTVVSKGGLSWNYWSDKDNKITLARLYYDLEADNPAAVHKFPDYRNVSGLSSTSEEIKIGRSLYPTQSYWDFSYEYSESGALTAITYPDGERIPFMPNAFGQATQADDYVYNARYWPNGSLKSLNYRNGVRSDFRQNNQHELSEIQHGTHWHQEFEIDGGKIVSAIYDHIKPTNSIRLNYDHIYQLKSVNDYYSDPTQPIQYERYEYDRQGNMTSRTGMNGTFHYNISPVTNRLVDVEVNNSETKFVGYDDELKMSVYGTKYFAYSDDGNLVYHDDSDNVVWTYVYDGNGRKTFTFKDGVLHQVTVYDHRDQLVYEEIVGEDGRTSNLIYLNDSLVARRDGEFFVTTKQCDKKISHRDFKTYFYERNVYLYKNDQNESYLAGNTNRADVAFVGECKKTPSRTFIHYADSDWTGWNTHNELYVRHFFRKMQYEKVKVGNSYENYYRGGFYDYPDVMDRIISKLWDSYSENYRKSTWWHYRDCYRGWKMVIQDQPNGQGPLSTGQVWRNGRIKFKAYKWHKFAGGKNHKKCQNNYGNSGDYVTDEYLKFPSASELPKPNYYTNIQFKNK